MIPKLSVPAQKLDGAAIEQTPVEVSIFGAPKPAPCERGCTEHMCTGSEVMIEQVASPLVRNGIVASLCMRRCIPVPATRSWSPRDSFVGGLFSPFSVANCSPEDAAPVRAIRARTRSAVGTRRNSRSPMS